MKIYFDNADISGRTRTGPNSFAHRLATQFAEDGHDVVGYKEEYDIFLCFIEPTHRPRIGCKVVQRLDGIWSTDPTGPKNQSMMQMYSRADCVVFQSEFDKQYITTHWNFPKNNHVIHNGAIIGKRPITQPGLTRIRQEFGVILVCSANWLNAQKRLDAHIEMYRHIKTIYSTPVCLLVLGDINPKQQIADPGIFYTGNVPHDVCFEIYSIADYMLHLEYGSHMPNTAIEALSTGCPVICSEVGGVKEVVGTGGIILKETNAFDFTKPFDYENPPKLDVSQLKELPEIIVDPTTVDIQKIAKKYINLFACL